MSAIAAVKLSGVIDNALIRRTNSATVSVDQILSPEGISPQGVAKWVNRSITTTNPSGVAIGYPALTMSILPPTKASRVSKVTVKLVLPTLEVTSPSTMTGISRLRRKRMTAWRSWSLCCQREALLLNGLFCSTTCNPCSCVRSTPPMLSRLIIRVRRWRTPFLRSRMCTNHTHVA